MSENLNARCKHDQFPFLCDTCEITKLQSQLAESESLRSVQWPSELDIKEALSL